MYTFFSALLFCILPSVDIVEEDVDIVEINHFYDNDGRHILSQMLFWNHIESFGDYHCVHYILVNKDMVPVSKDEQHKFESWWKENINGGILTPTKMRFVGHTKFFVDKHNIIFMDGNNIRKLKISTDYRHTHTQYDPEVEDKENINKEQRTQYRRTNIISSR